MKKKHYELIATGIRNGYAIAEGIDDTNGVWIAATQLAEVLAKDNPKFDKDKFLRACGITD